MKNGVKNKSVAFIILFSIRELLKCTRYHTNHECYCPEKNCNQQTGCVLIDHSKIVLRINGFVVHSSHVVENLQEELDEHG